MSPHTRKARIVNINKPFMRVKFSNKPIVQHTINKLRDKRGHSHNRMEIIKIKTRTELETQKGDKAQLTHRRQIIKILSTSPYLLIYIKSYVIFSSANFLTSIY